MSFQTDNSSEEISGVDVNTAKQKSRGRKHRARNNSPDLGRELSDEEFRDAVKFFKKQRDEELESKVYRLSMEGYVHGIYRNGFIHHLRHVLDRGGAGVVSSMMGVEGGCQLRTIRVDDEVFRELQKRAEPLVDTANDVLRDLLGLDDSSQGTSYKHSPVESDFNSSPQRPTTNGYHEAEIDDPVILIRIARLYRPGISEEELYEATRRMWRVGGPRRERAKYALAIHEGIVVEVYEIHEWSRVPETRTRWQFEGVRAPETIRSKYVGRSVRSYFRWGEQNPIKYVNCG